MLCGLATSPWMLTAFRAAQAVGAAMLFSNSPAILTENFPPEKRGQVLGLQATMTYLGLTVGPSLGGWLASQFGWRAVFYINVPVGLLATALSIRFIPRIAREQKSERFDLAGAALFLAGLVSLMLALNQGSEWGWTSLPILALLVIAVVLLALFVRYEKRIPGPMLDLGLFQSRPFSAAAVSAVFNYICLYSIIFLMPFYLIQGRQLTEVQAGILLTAQPIIMAIAAPISGTLSDRFGPRLLGTVGMLILGVGLFMLSRAGASAPLEYIAAGLAVSGLGTGIFISPNSSALMGAAPRNRQGIASGILATSRNVGMVTGVGLAGAIYATVLARSADVTGSAAQFDAISTAFLVASAVALLGMLSSATRGGTERKGG
jgi:EmrB/QacA subfamily drug resistance transporter